VGVIPYAVAVNPAGTRVYVTNQSSNTVSVIDAATNTVTATVAVGATPQGIAFNPSGTRAYVTNFSTQDVSVIDTAINTVTATVAVGARPLGVAVNPTGTRVYVANRFSNNVSVIDAATNAVSATVGIGANPYAFGQFIVPAAPTPVATAVVNPAQLTINGTSEGTDASNPGGFSVVTNPVRFTYYFPGCSNAELILAMYAPDIGLEWSFLDSSLQWRPLPASLDQITPFAPLFADNGMTQELFNGDLPSGRYDIFLVCDTRNGHLDTQNMARGPVLTGMSVHRVIRVP
jgi:YVTN family beta-propeller protein